MTPEQKAAFIFAQTSLMNLEIEAMKIENLNRQRDGLAYAYSEKAFDDVYHRYIIKLGEKPLIAFFNDI